MKFKKIAVLIAAMLMTAGTVYSAEVDYKRISGSVTISGESVEQGKTVRMLVLKPNADYDKLISGEASFWESCIHIAELKVNSEKYSFAPFIIKEGTPSGEYKVVLNEDGVVTELTIDYASVAQTLEFITKASDEDAVKGYVDKYNKEIYELPIGEGTEYFQLDDEARLKVLGKLIGTKYADVTALQTKFTASVAEYISDYRTDAFAAVSNRATGAEVLSAIDTYNRVYGIDREWELFKTLDSDDQADVYNKMTNEVYTSETQIQTAFKQKTILNYIQKGPWGKIPEYITAYNDILGLNLAKYSESNSGLLKAMVGVNCKTASDLQSIIDNYKETGSGGGYGGGSTGSSIKSNGYSGVITSEPSEQPQQSESSVFKDVPVSHWGYESINALYKKNIINGKENNMFAPDDNVTRSEAVKMIVLTVPLKEINSNSVQFTDISESSWDYEYVECAVRAGIVKGMDDNSFGGKNNITRQDLCVMIYRAIQNAGYDIADGMAVFTDIEQISDYALEAVSALTGENIISGMGDGSFNPLGYATRAQTAKIIYGVIK